MKRFLKLLPRKVLQSIVVGVLAAPVLLVVRAALQASGLLDPVAARLARGLGLYVSVGTLAWGAALVLAVLFWAGGIWLMVWLSAKSAPANTSPLRVSAPQTQSPFRLEVGEVEPLFVTTGEIATTRRWMKLRVSNIDPSRTARRVAAKVIEVLPAVDQRGPWTLFHDGVIEAGDSLLADIVSYTEPRQAGGAGDSFIHSGAFDRDLTLDVDHPSRLTVRVTGADAAYAELRCVIWVDGDRRLRILGLPSPDDQHGSGWIPLVDVVRYLVEDSVWGAALRPEDADFIRTAGQALKDRLGDDLKARGRRGVQSGGGFAQGLEPIPVAFWPSADFDVFGMLGNPQATSSARGARGAEWAEVVVDAAAVRSIWPPAWATGFVSNPYVLAMRAERVIQGG